MTSAPNALAARALAVSAKMGKAPPTAAGTPGAQFPTALAQPAAVRTVVRAAAPVAAAPVVATTAAAPAGKPMTALAAAAAAARAKAAAPAAVTTAPVVAAPATSGAPLAGLPPPIQTGVKKVPLEVDGQYFSVSVWESQSTKKWAGEVDGLAVKFDQGENEQGLMGILGLMIRKQLEAKAAAVPVAEPAVEVVAETAVETSPPVAAPAVEKPKRGRPKTAPAPAAETPVETPVAAAAVEEVVVPGPDPTVTPVYAVEPCGFTLYLDILPVKGPQLQSIEEIIAPARDRLESDMGNDYRIPAYSEGPRLLAAQILNDLNVNPIASGDFHVSTWLVDKEVLEVLCRKALHVYKGV